MLISRRGFAQLGLGTSLSLGADLLLNRQGISTHTAKPQPRSAPSGRPFHAHFVDIAHEAGLRAPIVYGPEGQARYLVEATGCGCAFIDYDNDGWMDIFVLSGTRLEGPPKGATNCVSC